MSWQEDKWRRRWRQGEKAVTWSVFLILALVVALQFDLIGTGGRGSPTGESYQPVLPAGRDESQLFGTLTLEVTGVQSLSQAVVLVNGQETLAFETAKVVLRVYPGDVVEIDASAYSRTLTFHLVSASSNIRLQSLNREITVHGGKSTVGTVTFK